MSTSIKLGHEPHISEDTIYKIDQFVCTMYKKKIYISSVDEARLQIFLEKYQLRNEEQIISCIIRLDGSILPPRSRVLLHIYV